MRGLNYNTLIKKGIGDLDPSDQKEVFDFVEFLKLRKNTKGNTFFKAMKEGHRIGNALKITKKDILDEIQEERRRHKS